MSLHVMLDISDEVSASLAGLADGLQDAAGLHAQIAGDAEIFIKQRGAATAATEHRTAAKLGAQPTGHLADAYQAIESISSAESAALLVPSASRLRAAFGSYVLTPKNGSKYLTIPVAAQAYGHRAGEFDDLEFLRVGPKKTAILARTGSDGVLETMYVLVEKATIPEDKTLIPFDDLAAEAGDSAQRFINEQIKSALGS